MRVILNIIYLCLLLLGGGQNLHANSQKINNTKNHCFEKNHRIRHINQDSGSSTIEDVDTDVDEEFHGGDDLNNRGNDNFLEKKQSFFYSSYLLFSSQFNFKDYSKEFENFAPTSGQPNPIYL